MIRLRDVQVDLNETFDTTPDTIKVGAVKYRVIFTLFKRIGLDTSILRISYTELSLIEKFEVFVARY
uniref:Uncharacterized protein n=1 Tax=Gibberella zeae TaxID=5518 RepID=A0A4E9E6X3_GIBZA